MKKLVVAFAGEMDSGKSTGVVLLRKKYPDAPSERFSNALRLFYTAQILPNLYPFVRKTEGLGWDDKLFAKSVLDHRIVAAVREVFGVVRFAHDKEVERFTDWFYDVFVPRHTNPIPDQASTEDLQDLSEKLRAAFGQKLLIEGVKKKILSTRGALAVIEGIRFPVDIEGWDDEHVMFRLVYVKADEALSFTRHRARNEKPGDANIDIDEFRRLRQKETESMIRLLETSAHLVIENNGSEEEYAEKIHREVDKWLLECGSFPS